MTEGELVLSRLLPASIDDVFAAWTDPSLMARWFFAGEKWTVDARRDLRVGGEFSLVMQTEVGEKFICSGVYREITPPTRLVFSWTSYAVTDTLVTVDLRAAGDATQLTLRHEGLVDAAIRQNHADGWFGCLRNLQIFLAAPAD